MLSLSSDLIGNPLRSLQVPRRARRGTEGGRAAVLRAAGARPPGHAGRREGRRPARQPGKGKELNKKELTIERVRTYAYAHTSLRIIHKVEMRDS